MAQQVQSQLDEMKSKIVWLQNIFKANKEAKPKLGPANGQQLNE